jgi:hypothetical protein
MLKAEFVGRITCRPPARDRCGDVCGPQMNQRPIPGRQDLRRPGTGS